MADEIIIETVSAEVIEVGVVGPQGPAGAAGTGLETLTTKGDTLYRGTSTGERLPIGATGQILRVSASGIPEWGAAPASGVISVNDQTGEVFLDSTDILTEQALQISDAGTADCNGVFIYGGLFNNRPTYYATKDTFVYWDGSNWVINHNGDDQYFGTATTYAWQAVWSLGDGANPLPVVTQAASHEFEQVVGQRTNPTSRGDAASKNVGTGANDVAAGNHTHSAATQSVAGFLSAADKTKLDSVASGAEVNVNADWSASSGDAQILNKPSSFTPSAHSSSHAPNGSDPFYPAAIYDPADNSIVLEYDASDGWTGLGSPSTFRSQLELGTAATADIGTAAGEVAAGDHGHGNLTSDGKLGSTSGLPVVTTTSGAVTTLALGTAGTVLTVNSGATGVEFAAASGGGSGGTKTYAVFTAEHNQPPAAAGTFATLDTRNSIAVLDFDAATDENAVFVGIMPEAASLGSGLIVRLHWMATSATSGNVRWGVQFERSNTDLDADSFAAAVEANGAANGTSGILTTTAITVTDFDGITAGDVFRLKVFRNADDATNDTMTGDAELVAVEVRSAA